MFNTSHRQTACYTKHHSLFEWVEVAFRLLVPPAVGLWIPNEKFKCFVAMGTHPWLVFRWAHFFKIKLKVPELLKLIVSQIVVGSLEIHYLDVSIEVPYK